MLDDYVLMIVFNNFYVVENFNGDIFGFVVVCLMEDYMVFSNLVVVFCV